ncbi:MAG: thiamine phosphate synthase [Prevotellaceae bacterium]|nr:thiamine phosphate synthase [Prevotellaceae bacterium]
MPRFIPDEARLISALLTGGRADVVHIRKPEAAISEVETLLLSIPQVFHCRLALHDHFSLAVKYHLSGVHTNSRNPLPPRGFLGSVSRSCHSLEEVSRLKRDYDFVSLSPVFDSISKAGYLSSFSVEQLRQAHEAGIIDEKVYALGGVTFSLLPEVRSIGFGGAMILGDAWPRDNISS